MANPWVRTHTFTFDPETQASTSTEPTTDGGESTRHCETCGGQLIYDPAGDTWFHRVVDYSHCDKPGEVD